jgi:phosphohistidine phosphatase SixA
MQQIIVLILVSILITACSQKYFIVRHAEKAQPSDGLVMSSPNDPPLTANGAVRAAVLAKRLANEKIRFIFSTNTIRTLSTAAPTANAFHLTVETYLQADSLFIAELKQIRRNTLIVAHSNTVDDLVNLLAAKHCIDDLGDNSYDNLFIVRRKGSKYVFSAEKYGAGTPK